MSDATLSVPSGSARSRSRRRWWPERLAAEAEHRADQASGRTHTAEVLRLIEEHGWVVRHDVVLSVRGPAIDHLVIGPSGAVVVASRMWNGRLAVRDGELWHNATSLQRCLEGVHRQAEAVQLALGRSTPVGMCLCVHDAQFPRPTFVHDSVLVVRPDHLLGALLRLRLKATARPMGLPVSARPVMTVVASA